MFTEMYAAATALPGGSNVMDKMVQGLCNVLEPLVGSNSQVLSIIFVVALGVMILMWFLKENKEGVIVWILRAGLAIAILINIFTLPHLLFGLPPIC